jgi:predicted SnoaL-like aldol condensation-catalyzing enzyme
MNEVFMRVKVCAALAFLLLAVAVCGAKDKAIKVEQQNKKVVVEFYEKGINQKDFDAASQYLGATYKQHNQRAADGIEGFKSFVEMLRQRFPDAHSDIRRVFADGDYVILHVFSVRVPGTRGQAVVDIFRLESGKIVEHWDVHEDIVEQPANPNTMF